MPQEPNRPVVTQPAHTHPEMDGSSALEADAQSLLLWKNGNQRGYNELVERYQRPLFHFIVRIIRDAEDAKDVLQETFIRLHRSLDRLREDKSLKAWLYQTANRLCIDYLRKHKPGRVAVVDHQEPATLAMLDSATEGTTTLKQPDEWMADRTLKDEVVAAIQKLPPKQRMAMSLRSCEGLSMKEIAAAMECSEQTVGTTLFAARKKLMQTLKPLLQDVYGKTDEPGRFGS